jgi:hypothetical protein
MVSTALIGQGRINKAVGDYDVPTLDRRRDELRNMLRAGGTMQQRFGTRLEITQVPVEEKRPDGFTNWRAAGLTGEDDGPASGLDPIGQRSGLG